MFGDFTLKISEAQKIPVEQTVVTLDFTLRSAQVRVLN